MLWAPLAQSFDWGQILANYGLPMLFLLGLGWFGVAKVWPFVTKHIETSQADRRETDKQFIAALAALTQEQRAQTTVMAQMGLSLTQVIAAQQAHTQNANANAQGQQQALVQLTRGIQALQQRGQK